MHNYERKLKKYTRYFFIEEIKRHKRNTVVIKTDRRNWNKKGEWFIPRKMDYQRLYDVHSHMFNSVNEFSRMLYVNSEYKLTKKEAYRIYNTVFENDKMFTKYDIIKMINFGTEFQDFMK